MPDGDLLTCDVASSPLTERLSAFSKTWLGTGNTVKGLATKVSNQIGPMVLRPDGTVFAVGATGHTAVYRQTSSVTGGWFPGPDLPKSPSGVQLDAADGPACVLPSGNVLVPASPGVFGLGTEWFEWTGAVLQQVPSHPSSAKYPSYPFDMLMLPNGQVWVTAQDGNVQLYSPTGEANNAWRPVVTSSPASVLMGQTYGVVGRQFNGLTQCSDYGDCNSNATNYPLVRLTNTSTGVVVYAPTFRHSTMGVATGAATVSTYFFVPGGLGDGPGTLQVVANGIASQAVKIVFRTH